MDYWMNNKVCFLDLFSGIGGFALAAYWAGLRFNEHYFSEIEPYAIEIYKKRFPDAISLGDITKIDFIELKKTGDWLVTGGFPCQPYSVAGKQRGKDDKRDLWPECNRILRELQPKIALFENVSGILNSDNGQFFNRVLSDISACGYDCEWQVISAAEVGAPHKRERVWICAYSAIESKRSGISNQERIETTQRDRFTNLCKTFSHADSERCQEQPYRIATRARDIDSPSCRNGNGDYWAVEPDVGRVAHGVPSRVDRLKGLGNAIVPQCAEVIFDLPAFDEWRIKNE